MFLVYYLDHNDTVFERRVYSLMDMLGEVGGLTDALLYIFRLLFFLLTPTSFMLELVKDFFSFRKIDHIMKARHAQKKMDQAKTSLKEVTNRKDKRRQLSLGSKDVALIIEEHLAKITSLELSSFTLRFQSVLRCLYRCCGGRKGARAARVQQSNIKLYEKATARAEKQLDIRTLMENSLYSKQLVKLLLNENQALLFSLQRSNLVEDSPGEISDPDPGDNLRHLRGKHTRRDVLSRFVGATLNQPPKNDFDRRLLKGVLFSLQDESENPHESAT